MNLILDASAAIAAILPHKNSSKVRSLIKDATFIIAPDLFISEVTNTIWKICTLGDLSQPKGKQALDTAVSLVDCLKPATEFYKETLNLAFSINHSAYDAFYLALARREDGTLLSLDKKLIKTAKKLGIKTCSL